MALSFGSGIAIVSLIGLVSNVTPWGIRLVPIREGNGSWTRRHNAAATLTGDNMRLTCRLYRGAAPEDQSVDNACRESAST